MDRDLEKNVLTVPIPLTALVIPDILVMLENCGYIGILCDTDLTVRQCAYVSIDFSFIMRLSIESLLSPEFKKQEACSSCRHVSTKGRYNLKRWLYPLE